MSPVRPWETSGVEFQYYDFARLFFTKGFNRIHVVVERRPVSPWLGAKSILFFILAFYVPSPSCSWQCPRWTGPWPCCSPWPWCHRLWLVEHHISVLTVCLTWLEWCLSRVFQFRKTKVLLSCRQNKKKSCKKVFWSIWALQVVHQVKFALLWIDNKICHL